MCIGDEGEVYVWRGEGGGERGGGEGCRGVQ